MKNINQMAKQLAESYNPGEIVFFDEIAEDAVNRFNVSEDVAMKIASIVENLI